MFGNLSKAREMGKLGRHNMMGKITRRNSGVTDRKKE